MQKKSLSFGDDPLLNDLNLLTRLLFFLVIFNKVFSMSNLKICNQLYFNYINILISYLLYFYIYIWIKSRLLVKLRQIKHLFFKQSDT